MSDIDTATQVNTENGDQMVKLVKATARGGTISLEFSTPNNNTPATFQNVIYLWQSGDQIPWSQKELKSQLITVDTPDGTVIFDGLDLANQSYIVGYAVGPVDPLIKWSKFSNVVASIFVPAKSPTGVDPQSASIAPCDIGTTSLLADYSFLDGYDPGSSGAWAGIWEGPAASRYSPPKWFSPITGPNNADAVAFNNILLRRGGTYTVASFSNGYSTDASKLNLRAQAAATVFKND